MIVQIPCLLAFDDVNKRLSRLAANIPLIKGNRGTLPFASVPRQTYTEAAFGVYELNKIDLLKDVFVWSYERPAACATQLCVNLLVTRSGFATTNNFKS
ncbi:MAG TPA: hypothetical protein VME69_06125 [Methylocella sp.]|nr:hypothetical protein [Methylocella sp.]